MLRIEINIFDSPVQLHLGKKNSASDQEIVSRVENMTIFKGM